MISIINIIAIFLVWTFEKERCLAFLYSPSHFIYLFEFELFILIDLRLNWCIKWLFNWGGDAKYFLEFLIINAVIIISVPHKTGFNYVNFPSSRPLFCLFFHLLNFYHKSISIFTRKNIQMNKLIKGKITTTAIENKSQLSYQFHSIW